MSSKFNVQSGQWVLIFALLIALYASYLLIAPYLGAIVLAFVLSLLCFPVHEYFENKMPDKPNLVACISCLLLVVVILVPASLVFVAIVQQGMVFTKQIYTWVEGGGAEQLLQHPLIDSTLTTLNQYSSSEYFSAQSIITKLTEFAAGFGKELLNLSTSLLGNITSMLFSFLLMLFILFFLLRDHKKVVHNIHWILPLSRSQEEALLTEAQAVSRSAVMGSLLTALAQGIAGGIAMAVVGLPGLFWGTIMAFASFIPVVGTALVWVPAALYLFIIGDWQWAIFMVFWGAVIVGSIDNFLRPILMQGSSQMNTLMVFLSLIGGLQLFGLIGLIYGPIIFALTLVLLRLYTLEFRDFLENQDKN